MKKIFFAITLVSVCVTLSSCESNAEKAYNTMKKVGEKYINDLNNADTEEDYRRIRKAYKARTKFEINKVTEQEIEEFERNVSWKDYNEAQDLNNRIKEAERNTKKRVIKEY